MKDYGRTGNQLGALRLAVKPKTRKQYVARTGKRKENAQPEKSRPRVSGRPSNKESPRLEDLWNTAAKTELGSARTELLTAALKLTAQQYDLVRAAFISGYAHLFVGQSKILLDRVVSMIERIAKPVDRLITIEAVAPFIPARVPKLVAQAVEDSIQYQDDKRYWQHVREIANVLQQPRPDEGLLVKGDLLDAIVKLARNLYPDVNQELLRQNFSRAIHATSEGRLALPEDFSDAGREVARARERAETMRRSSRAPDKRGSDQLPSLPNNLSWPSEKFGESPEAHSKDGIIRFLERVWAPLIESGFAERRLAARLDPSVIDGIKSFERSRSGSRSLPDHLRFLKVGEAKALRARRESDSVLARIRGVKTPEA